MPSIPVIDVNSSDFDPLTNLMRNNPGLVGKKKLHLMLSFLRLFARRFGYMSWTDDAD